jgi:hypothetical protein
MSREWNFDAPAGIADRDVGLAAVLRKVRYDLTAAQGALSEAMRMVATLDLGEEGERVPCPACGALLLGALTLAEHVHVSHDGPVPPHWLAIEARSADPQTVA